MGLPAITYTLVTIALLAICIYLIYVLVLPKFALFSSIIVLKYEIHIDNYTIAEISSNTKLSVINYKDLENHYCVIIKKTPVNIYIVCDCDESNLSVIPVNVCAGSTCKTLFIWCKK